LTPSSRKAENRMVKARDPRLRTPANTMARSPLPDQYLVSE
jgi:hypothetical protein